MRRLGTCSASPLSMNSRFLKILTPLSLLAAAPVLLANNVGAIGNGAITVPDTGSTALLLGAALVGAALGARRFLKK